MDGMLLTNDWKDFCCWYVSCWAGFCLSRRPIGRWNPRSLQKAPAIHSFKLGIFGQPITPQKLLKTISKSLRPWFLHRPKLFQRTTASTGDADGRGATSRSCLCCRRSKPRWRTVKRSAKGKRSAGARGIGEDGKVRRVVGGSLFLRGWRCVFWSDVCGFWWVPLALFHQELEKWKAWGLANKGLGWFGAAGPKPGTRFRKVPHKVAHLKA